MRHVLASALLVAFSLRAADNPAPALLGPEVLKLDWNTRALVARDLDGDGRVDLALLNNDRAAIELLYQNDPAAPARPAPAAAPANRWEPRLEDARFRKETLIVGQTLFDLAAADFNGDGRADLAVTGDPSPLLVRYAKPDGGWEETAYATSPAPVRFLGGLAAVDLDGDRLTDLVVLGQKEIALFRQRPDRGLVIEDKLPLGDDNAYGLLVTDVDGDDRPDLTYLVPGVREALRVRLQVDAGRFGPERSFPLKTPRSPLVRVGEPAPVVAPPVAARKRPAAQAATPHSSAPVRPALFASALGASGQLEFLRFAPAEAGDRWRVLAPRSFTPLASPRGAALYATGDFDRDGGSDLAVAFGESAQVFLYLRDAAGGFTLARRVPSLTDAKALGALSWTPGAAPDRLLVLSGKENALAELELAPDGAARPARALPLPGRLISFAAGVLRAPDAGQPGRSGIALVAEEDGKRALSLWTRDADGVLARGTTLVLAGLRADPRSVTLGDLDQDGLADVLVAVPSAGVRVYLQKPDGALVDAADRAVYRPGLLARPEAALAPLAWGDADGDGRDELLVAAENFLRALRIDAEGALEIVAQYDARDVGSEVSTGLLLPDEPAGSAPRAVLHDRKADQLHLLERAPGAAAHEAVDVRGVARLDVTGSFRLLGPAGRREWVLLGKDRFWWMPEGASDFALQTAGTFASDLPDVRYFYLAEGDLDGDGRGDLVGVDINENTVEVLARDADDAWRPRLHFKVFDSDPHYEGNRGGGQEPREAVIADVTGDGRADLVLLVHDRLLVYPRE